VPMAPEPHSWDLAADHVVAGARVDSKDEDEMRRGAQFLVASAIGNPEVYLEGKANRVRKAFRDVLSPMIADVREKNDSSFQRGDILEAIALMHVVLDEQESAIFRQVTPNLQVYWSDNPDDKNEYDLVEFAILQKKKLRLQVWGCTVEKDHARKTTDDLDKMNKLRNAVMRRFDDVQVICDNYFYLDGQGIWELRQGHKKGLKY